MNHQNGITIFTDGSSRGNPGPGGWGAVIVQSESATVMELGGGEKDTTNNRMELMAAIQGLKKVKNMKNDRQKSHVIPARSHVITAKAGIQSSAVSNGMQVNIFSDSSYVINGITKWVKGWRRNGWQTKTRQGVLNRDLWEELDELDSKLSVKWNYVGGHVGILGNERCDHIATAFADGMKIKLYEGPLARYDLPNILDISLDEALQSRKSSSSAHSRAKAYSYVSMIQGVIETHRTWAECEKRVKGAKGAKYRKAISVDDEAQIMAEFEAV